MSFNKQETCDTMKCNTIQRSTMKYDDTVVCAACTGVQRNVPECGAVQCNAVQCERQYSEL